MLTPFHLAIPVSDLTASRQFYGEMLGCEEGRSSDHWIDFKFFGHQLVCHLVADHRGVLSSNPVDGEDVPIPHFGVVMEMAQWQELAERLTSRSIDFIIEPTIRFAGQAGEQATLFFLDPSGNALEFKAFKNIEQQLFAV